ncbi:hypothetical protein Taro_027623 [Colocasia esculenta]|uniref:Uncharacterized protein n=1 Tax=Colocasia esculenta TaxID=4460 RepID=A0A843VIL1_COLES|nr:hypothetical protein [Colocasia esculenta]
MRITGGVMTPMPVRLPGSSRPLMVENVAWDGYNRSVGQGSCSVPFGRTFRAGDPHRGRTCCSVMSGVVPRSRATALVRKAPANELGNASLGTAGA